VYLLISEKDLLRLNSKLQERLMIGMKVDKLLFHLDINPIQSSNRIQSSTELRIFRIQNN